MKTSMLETKRDGVTENLLVEMVSSIKITKLHADTFPRAQRVGFEIGGDPVDEERLEDVIGEVNAQGGDDVVENVSGIHTIRDRTRDRVPEDPQGGRLQLRLLDRLPHPEIELKFEEGMCCVVP
ncbi:hypothetical protein MLD38_035914 [Melastoma candidum]|uniref:Uncharacterized protein n=1 Tax=Melastoma candidum TaxID=119954 RepID=A0ACB9LIZ0_9MYRT|nr:hypothetical protein MLD38_035914 [Melastoma candidum]